MRVSSKLRKELRCNFCHRGKDATTHFISGGSGFICRECVGLCNDIFAEYDRDIAESARVGLSRGAEPEMTPQELEDEAFGNVEEESPPRGEAETPTDTTLAQIIADAKEGLAATDAYTAPRLAFQRILNRAEAIAYSRKKLAGRPREEFRLLLGEVIRRHSAMTRLYESPTCGEIGFREAEKALDAAHQALESFCERSNAD